MVACAEVLISRVESAPARVRAANVAHNRIRRVNDSASGASQSQRDVGFFAQTRAWIEVADASDGAHSVKTQRHVRTKHVIDFDDSSWIGGEETGQSAVRQKKSNLADALICFAWLSVDRAPADRDHVSVCVWLKQHLEPLRLGECVVIDESDNVFVGIGDPNGARRCRCASTEFIASILDVGKIAHNLTRRHIRRRIDNGDPSRFERLLGEMLQAGAHILGSSICDNDDPGRRHSMSPVAAQQ
jgi:hypothetical protein